MLDNLWTDSKDQNNKMNLLKKIIKTTALTAFCTTLAFSEPDKTLDKKIQKEEITILSPSIAVDPKSKTPILPGSFRFIWNRLLKNGDSFGIKGGYNYYYNNTKDLEDLRKAQGTITERKTGSLEAGIILNRPWGIFNLKGNFEGGVWEDTNYNTIHKGELFGQVVDILEVERLYNFTRTFAGADLSVETSLKDIFLNPKNNFCRILLNGDIYTNLVLGSLTNNEDIKSKIIFYEEPINLPESEVKKKIDFLSELYLEGGAGLNFLFDNFHLNLAGKTGIKTNIGPVKQTTDSMQEGFFNQKYPNLEELALIGYKGNLVFGFGGTDDKFSHLTRISYKYQDVTKREESEEVLSQLRGQEHLWKFYEAFNKKKLNFIISLGNKIETNSAKIITEDENLSVQGYRHIINPSFCFIYGLDAEGLKKYVDKTVNSSDKKSLEKYSLKPYINSTSSIEDIMSRLSDNILFLVGIEGTFSLNPNTASYVMQENFGLMENKDYSFGVKAEIFSNILGMMEDNLSDKSPLLGLYTSAQYLYNNSELSQVQTKENKFSVPLTFNLEERLDFNTGVAFGNFKGHGFKWYIGLEARAINIQRGPEGRYNITTGMTIPIIKPKNRTEKD